MTRILAALSMTLLVSGAASAQTEMMRVDADADGMITAEEYATVETTFGQLFVNVDTDEDGMISEEEYNAAAFEVADEDQSNTIDEGEATRYRELTRMF